MINIEKLLSAQRVEVTYFSIEVDADFVKECRKKCGLTQVGLANVLGVKRKLVEKWEKGCKKVKGSSAVLLHLLSNDVTLLQKIYLRNIVTTEI